jgi:hypothetical protein
MSGLKILRNHPINTVGLAGSLALRAHPLLAAERSATASYQRQLKASGIKF